MKRLSSGKRGAHERVQRRSERLPSPEDATAIAKVENTDIDVSLDEPREEPYPDWLPARLLPSEEKFCLLYLQNNCSGADAIVAMRPDISSRDAARHAAHRLLKRPEIQARILALSEEIAAELKYSARKVFLELVRIARADVRKLYDEAGSLRPVHELG